MKNTQILIMIITIFGMNSFNVSAEPGKNASESSWTYQIEPYLFINNIDGNSKIGIAPNAELNVDFSTIFDNLNMAGMLHFEAHHDSGWGLIVDYSFMDLGKDGSKDTGGIAKVGVRQGVLEGIALYRVKYGNNKVDYFSGVRWWDNDMSLSFARNDLPPFVDVEVKEDWVDVFVGARWFFPISEDWGIVTKADIGGFGLTSDFTSVTEVGATYNISNSMILTMKYKGVWVDYDNDKKGRDKFEYDTITHGPVISLIFEF